MKYTDFNDKKLSLLGLGAMRLPVIDGDISHIDEELSEKMVDLAMAHGINYYDTAWGYHEGNSERVLGKLLSKYPRESYYLANKFPGYDLDNMPHVEKIFEEQLERCGVEYFDFYMFHNVCETNIDGYLNEEYGILQYLLKQKQNGRIKHLGFSTHAAEETFLRFMDAYGEYMEFCQIQLNYIDWTLQDAKMKVEYLNAKNIPIIVMEPLRGGSLAKVDDEYDKKLKELRPDEKTAAWAFRYLEGISGVKVILSGMSNLEQLSENIATFDEERPLDEKEREVLMDIASGMLKNVLQCTACRYCTSYCPQGLDIPRLIELYNEHDYSGGGWLAPMMLEAIPEEKHPSACIGCGSCETVCPQNIEIAKAMADFAEMLKK